MNKLISIGNYLLLRLNQLGIKHIFGLPGDYNLLFLDQIVYSKNIKWINCTNELNASYAADGYAKLNGMGAIATTFGVGELSAINGIAGSYAERVPVIHIVGMPSTEIQKQKLIVHHTLCNKKFDDYVNMVKHITVAQAIISEKNAQKEIDRILEKSWKNKLPGYIGIPVDLFHKKIKVDIKPLSLRYSPSNKKTLNAIAKKTFEKLKKSKKPLIIIDLLAKRNADLNKLILKFLHNTKLPFVNLNMAKAAIDENLPNYLGNYAGIISSPGIQKKVEASDCIIALGFLKTDINAVENINEPFSLNCFLEIHNQYSKIDNTTYNNMYCCDVLSEIIKECKKNKYQTKEKYSKSVEKTTKKKLSNTISHESFWEKMKSFLKPKDTIIVETGSSSFAALHFLTPKNSEFMCQGLWSSIGYSLGALLGACLAKPKNRSILVIGDGSFQLTAQCLSTIMRNKLSPIIFLINNEGYTIERVIHGWKMPYNDIQNWSYHELPKVFGKNYWSTKVKTQNELNKALMQAAKIKNKLIFIEVIMKKTDVPILLQKFLKK